MKNKTSLKNKTSKVVGGKKLRSKTNRRKSKSRFSKKTLKRGGKPNLPWYKWGMSKGADPKKKEVDPEYEELLAQQAAQIKAAEALVAKIKKMHPLNSEGRRLDSKGNIIDSDLEFTKMEAEMESKQDEARISEVGHIIRKARARDEQGRTPRKSNKK